MALRNRAFTDDLRAGEHEQRTTTMTALQDWLSYRPMHPRTLKALICDTFRAQPAEAAGEHAVPAEPTLLRPGLERC
ncbi:hypothetical protein AU184_05470 [Mycolicibacterium novocastrense]|nr:hypothetical protein AU072_06975 [Mycolicibacterium novocastrense]KUH65820.1 hypothetical protein AU183_14350 [Mycolicibacterium novocastrense]KUH67026.1 hypothetical protein AU184_05470 [Mycolicibacterium novocastrense]